VDINVDTFYWLSTSIIVNCNSEYRKLSMEAEQSRLYQPPQGTGACLSKVSVMKLPEKPDAEAIGCHTEPQQ
jgi:hypothetical protein